ncbi:hypothetical protein [uncultured Microbacterium sp.]|uniref:hypothetical protein n=1 Tax=uncultured Microbacterium sp. TaxID=191216 RepID=UPI0025E372E1|nr:hypothetical protein [uncultured Microbacterium sp.]
MTGKPTPGRAASGRAGMESRWAEYRAARLAAGKPATVREEQGRKPDRFSDPEIEAYWIERAEAARVIPDGATSTQVRRIAFRYAKSVESETSRRATEKVAAPLTGTDERVAYYEAEIERLTNAERMDRRRADEHQRQREAAESILADILFRGSGA